MVVCVCVCVCVVIVPRTHARMRNWVRCSLCPVLNATVERTCVVPLICVCLCVYLYAGFDGYRDVSTKGFLRNFARGLAPPATGAPDAQANCIARTAPLAAGWCGQPEPLARAVRLGTRVTQNADAAVVWGGAAADILSHVILGVSPSQATRMVIAALQHAARAGTEDNTVQQPTR